MNHYRQFFGNIKIYRFFICKKVFFKAKNLANTKISLSLQGLIRFAFVLDMIYLTQKFGILPYLTLF